VPDPKRRGAKSERILLRGDVPSPISPPSGCRFHTRCWKATEICKTTEPQLVELRPGQRVACHHPENFADQAPQDVVLLTAAKEAAELVADEVLAESAATSAAVAAEITDSPAADAAEAPEALETTEATEVSEAPQTTEVPEAAEAGEEPEVTEAPAVTEATEVTEAPEAPGTSDGETPAKEK
jgi:peptide/nickel transport system ATP-binding protein